MALALPVADAFEQSEVDSPNVGDLDGSWIFRNHPWNSSFEASVPSPGHRPEYSFHGKNLTLISFFFFFLMSSLLQSSSFCPPFALFLYNATLCWWDKLIDLWTDQFFYLQEPDCPWPGGSGIQFWSQWRPSSLPSFEGCSRQMPAYQAGRCLGHPVAVGDLGIGGVSSSEKFHPETLSNMAASIALNHCTEGSSVRVKQWHFSVLHQSSRRK